ncbi:MAG TPA: aspartyl protease family protein [Pyrinomonadaceae bacterium]|jgi:predicted aspartyl protease|nr:aspartyl protease family protein [Pyrinomonadaceae bacterium]
MHTRNSLSWQALALLLLAVIGPSVYGQGAQGERRMMMPPEKIALRFPAGKSVVEVPFEVDRDLMVIRLSVNNSRPLRFVLDTGAQGTVLNNSSVIDSLRLNIVGTVQVRGSGSGPMGTASVAEGVSFDIASVKLTGGRLALQPLRPGSPFSEYDGVIGRVLFENLVVEVDWEKQALRFYDPAKYVYAGTGAILPLTFDEGGRPYATASVVISGEASLPVKVVVDTGASHALSLDVGSHPGLRLPEGATPAVLGIGANGEVRGHRGRVKSFQLGGYTLKDVPTTFPDASAGTAGIGGRQGNLGDAALKRFKIIYDYSRKRMIVEPNKFLNEPFGSPNLQRTIASLPTVSSSTGVLQDYVGRYGNKEISVRDGGLYYQRIGGRGAALRAIAHDKFALNTDAQITFLRDAKGVVTEMLIEWVERDKERLKRGSPAASQSQSQPAQPGMR